MPLRAATAAPREAAAYGTEGADVESADANAEAPASVRFFLRSQYLKTGLDLDRPPPLSPSSSVSPCDRLGSGI